MGIRAYFLILLTSSFLYIDKTSFAQIVRIYGDISENGMRLKKAKAQIFNNGVLIEEIITSNDGKFVFKIEEREEYELIFSKRGYVNQRYILDLKGAPIGKELYYGPWPIVLFKELEGSTSDVYRLPVGKLIFHSESQNIAFDKSFHSKISNELKAVRKEVELRSEQLDLKKEKPPTRKEIKLQDEKLVESEYNYILKEAHVLFREFKYESSLQRYQQASLMMPNEPFPKAKITDLEVIISSMSKLSKGGESDSSKNEAILTIKRILAEQHIDSSEAGSRMDVEKELLDHMSNISDPDKIEIKNTEGPERLAPVKVPQKVVPQIIYTTDDEEISLEDLQKQLAIDFPDGVTEERYKEGNKEIIKRIVVRDGKGNQYRKVIHNWGGIYYFKNGISVGELVWRKETEDPFKK